MLKILEKNDVGIVTFSEPTELAYLANAKQTNLPKMVLEMTQKTKIVLNMENVTDMDSDAIGRILLLFKKLQDRNGDLRLANMNPPVKTKLEKLRINIFIEFFDNIEDAVTSFN